MLHSDTMQSEVHPQPSAITENNLNVFSTRRVFSELGFQETNIILIEMLKTFTDHPYDMFVLSPTPEGQTAVRLAGYHFQTNELNEKKIISTIRLTISETIWFKIDDHGTHYIGTLLFPDEY